MCGGAHVELSMSLQNILFLQTPFQPAVRIHRVITDPLNSEDKLVSQIQPACLSCKVINREYLLSLTLEFLHHALPGSLRHSPVLHQVSVVQEL